MSHERIESDPLDAGMSIATILEDHPRLTTEDVAAVKAFAHPVNLTP